MAFWLLLLTACDIAIAPVPQRRVNPRQSLSRISTHIRAYWAKKKKVLDEIVLKDTLGEHSEA